MADQISRLSISAGYDSSQFVQGMAAQVRASQQGAEGALQLARAMVQADNAASSSASKGLVSLSRAWVEGYKNAATFEQAINRVSTAGAKDAGVWDRAGSIYENIVRKFGLMADAQAVLARGQPQLAAAVEQVNARFTQATAAAAGYQAVIERVAASNAKVNAEPASAAVQRTVNKFAGIGQRPATEQGAGHEALEADSKRQAAATDVLISKYAPLIAAEKQHAQAVKEINALYADGHIKADEQATALTRVAVTHQAQVYAINQNDAALKKLGAAGGLTAYQMQNLGFQVNDVVTGLVSGQPVFQIAAQQMGQIVQILQGANGGVGGAFASIKNKILELVTPLRLVGGLLAAVGVGGLLAANRVVDQERESRQALGGGRGRLLGATPEDLSSASLRTSGNGVSLRESREGILEGVRAGVPNLDLIEKANALAKRYAVTTGTELKDAQKELAQAMAEPAKGAETLNEKLNFLDSTTLKYIQSLDRQGQKAQAAKVLFDAMPPALVKQADSVSWLSKQYAELSTTVDRAIDRLGRLATFQAKDEASARAQAEDLANKFSRGPATAIRGETSRIAAPSRADQSRSDERYAAARVADSAAGFAAEQERQRLLYNGPQTQAIVDRTNPAIQQRDNLADDRTRLQERIKFNGPDSATLKQDAEAVAELNREIAGYNKLLRDTEKAGGPAKLSVEQLTQAYQAELETIRALTPAQKAAAAASTVKAQNFGTNISPFEDSVRQQIASEKVLAEAQQATQERMKGRDIAFQSSIRSIQAFTIAEKAAAASTNAYNQTLFETKNATEAAQAARQAGIQVQEQATVQMRDQLREQQQLIGIQQLEAQYIGASDEARSVAIARRQAENTLINQGRDLLDSQSQAYIANAAAIAQNNSKLEEAKRAQREYAQEVQRTMQILQQQGRDPFSSPMHTQGGTTRPSDWPQAQSFTTAVTPDPIIAAAADAAYGPGNYGWKAVGGFGINGGSVKAMPVPNMTAITAQNEQRATARQQAEMEALNKAISLTSSALQKWQSQLGDAEGQISDAEQKVSEAKAKVEKAESDRQAKIQKYLSAGPSPYDHNPDIFYDPAKRMAFAEEITGSNDKLLEQNVTAAEAEAKAAEDAAQIAKDQISKLQAQEDQLNEATDLMSAGVDLSKQEVSGIIQLIGVVRNELPANIAAQLDRTLGATINQATQTIAQNKTLGGGIGVAVPFVKTAASSGALGGLAGLTGSASSLFPISTGPRTSGATFGGLGSFATGGEFTVPGSGTGDRPYGINLTPGEHIKVTPAGEYGGTASPIVNQYFDVRGAEPRQIRQSRGEWAQGMAGGISRAMRA